MKITVFAIAAALLSASPAFAGCYEELGCSDSVEFRKSDLAAYSCQILWDLRNTIYKENGYCFKTERAISYFGNVGCWLGDQEAVKLNAYERYNVGVIRSIESARQCP